MVMLQIRHVPEEVHCELKVRAARAGQSLSDFVLAELTRMATRPTLDEIAARVRARDLAHPRGDLELTVDLAAAHDEREAHLADLTLRDRDTVATTHGSPR